MRVCTYGHVEGVCCSGVYTFQPCCRSLPVGRCDGDVAYLALQRHLCFAVPVHRGAGHLQCSAPLLLPAKSMVPPSAPCSIEKLNCVHERPPTVLGCQRLQSCLAGHCSQGELANGETWEKLTAYARDISSCAFWTPSSPSASPKMFSMMLHRATHLNNCPGSSNCPFTSSTPGQPNLMPHNHGMSTCCSHSPTLPGQACLEHVGNDIRIAVRREGWD